MTKRYWKPNTRQSRERLVLVCPYCGQRGVHDTHECAPPRSRDVEQDHEDALAIDTAREEGY